MSRFLAAYEDLFAKSTDAPVEFGHAGGLAVLSTIALGRRWIERGAEKIHPNLFMLLCADSSRDRKSTSVKIAMNLLKNIEKCRVGPDNFTPAGLFNYMQKEEHRRIVLPLGEFGVFLAYAASHSSDLYAEMCNLYDNLDVHRLRAKETITIESPLASIFGGVAYGMLEKYMSQAAWDMGFYPRVFWVTPITRREPFTMVPTTPFTERKIVEDKLKDLFTAITQSVDGWGAMRLATGAEDGYEAFANSLTSDEKQEDATVNAQRERLKNMVFKLAMLYQLDIDPCAEISAAAMDQAYAFAKLSWASFKIVFGKTYGAVLDRFNSKIWQYIHDNQNGQISYKVKKKVKDVEQEVEIVDDGVWRHDLNRWQHRKLRDLEGAISTLIQRGVIQDCKVTGSNNKDSVYYRAVQAPPE